MDDATSRARAVFEEHLPHLVSDDVRRDADLLVVALTAAGLSIIDTRTHVAVPREPSKELVERVARAIQQVAERNGAAPWNLLATISKRAQEDRRDDARAAIAALKQEGE